MLQIHRAERAGGLAEALGSLLRDPVGDPFGPEVVAVPARGMERWLTQQLSARLGAQAGRRDGVCAGVSFPSPWQLIDDAVATASGIAPDADPWRAERLTWPLLAVIESSLSETWLRPLAAYLGHAADTPDASHRARRLGTVRHLAGLFWRYGLHRPELLGAWARGEDAPRGDPALPSSAAWQAELWRRLRARIAEPDPAQRITAACQRIEQEPELLALPARIAVFGLTRMPAGHLRVLRALSVQREVHLFLLHPSPVLWQRLADELQPSCDVVTPIVRRTDPTSDRAANPLLRSWGRDVRELQLLIAGSGPFRDHYHDSAPAPTTLLGQIQAAVRTDLPPPGAPYPGVPDRRAPLALADRSLQIHACHGRARQVEVVRDAVLHALAANETLEPRDVIVMCPDIETFAPLIGATFGAGEVALASELQALEQELRPVDLRVRLADRSLHQTNPVLGVVTALLELSGGRVTASQVLDLADREPVRRRFGFDDDDLTRLGGWVADAGVRWGLDAAHRAPFKLDAVGAGTWRAGLDRVLLGVAMSEDEQRLFGGVLPLDDVDGGSIDLAGRLAELIDRLGQALDSLRTAQPLAAWAAAITRSADLLSRPSERDLWQRAQLQRIIDELLSEAGAAAGARGVEGDGGAGGSGGAPGPKLELAEMRALLAERLAGRPTRANFRTGHLTVCTLVPMRSVPHRVVCLLGLDDGAFPRKTPMDGDDVMLEEPRIGERDARSEDRQLLLDALMAAGERLIITYSGNDERTNLVQPPAVPVGELLDVIDATVSAPGTRARDHVLVRHPLQPFDPRNFTSGALVPDVSWSFDPVTRDGARALAGTGERASAPPFLRAPLPALASDAFELEDLLRFVRHPVKAFLRRRLSVSLFERSDEVADALQIELDGLERWSIGQDLLDARLAGAEGRAAWLAAIARGTLPPGELGRPVLTEIYSTAEAIVAAVTALSGPPAVSIDVHLRLQGGATLTGTVPGLSGETLIDSTYSRLAAPHRIAAWVRLLALTLADPERAYTAVTVGRARDGEIAVQRIRPLGETPQHRQMLAGEKLGALLDLYARGMREPLPIFCKTSAAYARAVHEQRDPLKAASTEWEPGPTFDRESGDAEHRMALGGVLSLQQMLAEPPASDEFGAGWDPSTDSRFARLACRMWDGLLEFEELS